MGRFSDVCSRMGANVVAIDLSTAVTAAQRNIGHRPNVSVIQADLRSLPFPQEMFDIICSIGVVQYSPNPRQSALSLLPYLKPCGRICVAVSWKGARWRGKYSIPGINICGDLIQRRMSSRISGQRLLQFCRWRAKLYPVEQKVFPLRVLLAFLLPGCQHPESEWRILDNFNRYSPGSRSRHTSSEVEEWFEEAGLVDIKSHEVPVSVSAIKPE
jgi:SAM-dependent methyltransferase